jgi:hypothetical protein
MLRKKLKLWAETSKTPVWKKEGCDPKPCAGYTEFFGTSYAHAFVATRGVASTNTSDLKRNQMRLYAAVAPAGVKQSTNGETRNTSRMLGF